MQAQHETQGSNATGGGTAPVDRSDGKGRTSALMEHDDEFEDDDSELIVASTSIWIRTSRSTTMPTWA